MNTNRMVVFSGILGVAAAAVTLFLIRDGSADTVQSADSPATLKEIGAYFVPDYSKVVPAPINSEISREEAHESALTYFLEGWDIPPGVGVEEKVTFKDTTGLFSGSASSNRDMHEWDIFDRDVWIVVLHDIPVSIPCGRGLTEAGTTPRPTPRPPCSPPRMSFAIDARTGEVLTSELLGGGSTTWSNEEHDAMKTAIAAKRRSPLAPTPTPTPTPTAAPVS